MKLLFAASLFFSVAVLPAHAVDQEKLQLAREVIQLTQKDQMMDSVTSMIHQLGAAQLQEQNLSPEQKAEIEAVQKETIAAAMDAVKTMLSKLDEVYADVYSVEELRAMKAFFGSAEGRAMIQKQPELMKRMTPMIMEMQKTIMAKAQGAVQQQKKKEKAAVEQK